ncbi:hypothetical protein BV25DRAFT_1824623 [Artomyces pyxidatus]|uniref:Uncharacterized protein n=1 Tax=Artomyces pyxidatus TaxID=48021 RepID=A0ACB8T4N8_9AGAM|nr:hypothetical protein BV25DRAFT_1824623 [Artomyces pyxidatus]
MAAGMKPARNPGEWKEESALEVDEEKWAGPGRGDEAARARSEGGGGGRQGGEGAAGGLWGCLAAGRDVAASCIRRRSSSVAAAEASSLLPPPSLLVPGDGGDDEHIAQPSCSLLPFSFPLDLSCTCRSPDDCALSNQA